MKILQLNDNRFRVALDLFKEGKSFNFSDVDFYFDIDNKILQIRVFIRSKLEDLTEQNALSEIQRGRKVLHSLLEQSSQFREIVQNSHPRFSLVQDYGNGVAEICYQTNEKLVWN
jgi:hypothetical protein